MPPVGSQRAGPGRVINEKIESGRVEESGDGDIEAT